MKLIKFLLAFIGLFQNSTVLAGILTAHVGPVALGGGGPNPLSIPPLQPVEYEFVYITDGDSEFRLGISPGIFYGIRSPGSKHGLYVSAGGGIVINGNGTGIGAYTAVGYNTECDFICFNAEYLAAIGIAGNKTLNPYAVRIGASFYFN